MLIALEKDNPEIAKMLIEAGADVNITNENGEQTIHFAAKKGNLEIVSLLLEEGADVSTDEEDTLLTAAVSVV